MFHNGLIIPIIAVILIAAFSTRRCGPREERDNYHHRHGNRVISGLFLLVAGFGLLAYKLGFPLPAWVFTWHFAMIYAGLFLLVRSRFTGLGGWILLLIGAVNLLDAEIPDLHFDDYIAAIIIIAIGMVFILRPKKRIYTSRPGEPLTGQEWVRPPAPTPQTPADQTQESYNRPVTGSPDASSSGFGASTPEFIDSTAILGGLKKVVVSKNFQGGRITCFLGGAEIDLSQADIQGEVRLEITQVLGGIKLIVPSHWDIKTEMTAFFAGIEDKRAIGGRMIDPGKRLVLHGTSVMAGIDIRNF